MKFKKPVVLPKSILPKNKIKKLNKLKVLDYGVGISENKFEILDNCSSVPNFIL